MYQITEPQGEAQLERYFQFRWKVLNEPMRLPFGSERDAYDSHSLHRMLQTHHGEIVAVGRVFISDSEEALIKYLAVDPDRRGQGIGVALMMALEQAARKEGVKRLVLNGRGDCIGFFERCGFKAAGDPVFDKGTLVRQQMVKTLDDLAIFVRQPELCRQLQQLYKSHIPPSEKMGLRLMRYSGPQLETRAPYGGNINAHDSMFAGSSYSLAVLTGWGMVWLMTRELGLEVDIILAKGEIHHRKPITEDATALVEKSRMHGSLLPLIEGKRSRMKLEVSIHSGGALAAEFHGVFMLVPHPHEADQ
jgi:thioesterase domain-containing protein